jgi:hypothetical protein
MIRKYKKKKEFKLKKKNIFKKNDHAAITNTPEASNYESFTSVRFCGHDYLIIIHQ